MFGCPAVTFGPRSARRYRKRRRAGRTFTTSYITADRQLHTAALLTLLHPDNRVREKEIESTEAEAPITTPTSARPPFTHHVRPPHPPTTTCSLHRPHFRPHWPPAPPTSLPTAPAPAPAASLLAPLLSLLDFFRSHILQRLVVLAKRQNPPPPKRTLEPASDQADQRRQYNRFRWRAGGQHVLATIGVANWAVVLWRACEYSLRVFIFY